MLQKILSLLKREEASHIIAAVKNELAQEMKKHAAKSHNSFQDVFWLKSLADSLIYYAHKTHTSELHNQLPSHQDTTAQAARDSFIRQSLGDSPNAAKLYEKVLIVAKEPTTVLLLGETGSGKSYTAELLHNISHREGTFAEMNCGAVPPNEQISILRGIEKSAFTDVGQQTSLLLTAGAGTVFLDEIAYATRDFQAELLKIIDKRVVTPAGSRTPISVEARFIFGTNQDMKQMVKDGIFMHDLYARIATSRVFTILPLRDRKEDIGSYAINRLIELSAREDSHKRMGIDDDAIIQLQSYHWPGNVRQLRNHLELLYYDARHLGSWVITKELVLKNEPDENLYLGQADTDKYETLIRESLSTWDTTRGLFLYDYLIPIVAKVYIDDLKKPKTKANGILGIDSTHAGKGINEMYDKYFKIRSTPKV